MTFVLLDKKIVGRTTPEETFRTNGVIAFKDRKGRRMEIFRATRPTIPTWRGVTVRRWPQARCSSRRAKRSNTPPAAASTPAAIPHADRQTRRRNGRDGRNRRRFKGQGEGTTIAETAYIARQLGLVEALNLDGGGSSTLWTAREGSAQPSLRQPPFRPRRRARRAQLHRGPQVNADGPGIKKRGPMKSIGPRFPIKQRVSYRTDRTYCSYILS